MQRSHSIPWIGNWFKAPRWWFIRRVLVARKASYVRHRVNGADEEREVALCLLWTERVAALSEHDCVAVDHACVADKENA